ncbi:MAG: peptidoglycan-associated lipoprotein [Bdellovibrionales bacterium CG12_big_fil_rev_8_21_14_0_65_38_15]|nr:MAG: peptidoglycan-associated lipoprotein [Bdellovibrionales bacterium CG22_combo_CG10-13_8_21_14_all_38_13]PIQ52486.1 MAG: peptidoglycan-associated lipoprotein [Bdellovibrionales bacterium CG12_big_fil_rev_8_21_14_0_65_38_15]PIR29524.1 MAG: peptidoglycan-associated lipoprotein [Bdellovibrionales bacterium CG11_big_fil_rev_8_21_14_0_20_38_13]
MSVSLRSLLSVLILGLSVALTGCGSSSKKASSDSSMSSPDSSSEDSSLELNGDSDSNKAGGLSTVFFEYDSSTLSSSARSTLEGNVSFLKDNTSVEVQIEGHCDERGGVQYNLALGERRAKAVRDYMVAMGVEKSRVTTISFGKERPLAFGHDNSAWGQNRRANFVVTAK